MPTRMKAEPKSRYNVSFIAAYSFVPTPVSRYAQAKMPRGRTSPVEPQIPMSRYIGSTGTPRVMDVIASSPPELSPDEEEEHAEGDTVDVVLGLAALDPAEHVATSQRPRAQHIQNAVDEVAVDPTDQAREAQDKATVESGVERVEAVPPTRQEVDRAEQRGQRGRAHDPALIGRPRQHEA